MQAATSLSRRTAIPPRVKRPYSVAYTVTGPVHMRGEVSLSRRDGAAARTSVWGDFRPAPAKARQAALDAGAGLRQNCKSPLGRGSSCPQRFLLLDCSTARRRRVAASVSLTLPLFSEGGRQGQCAADLNTALLSHCGRPASCDRWPVRQLDDATERSDEWSDYPQRGAYDDELRRQAYHGRVW